jgi:peroxiredoxin
MNLVHVGRPAPWFVAPSHFNPRYSFSSLGGRYILLVFLPSDPAQAATAIARLQTNEALFDATRIAALAVTRSPELHASLTEGYGFRWILDEDGAVSRLYGALDAEGAETPCWIVIDPSLRIFVVGRDDEADRVFGVLAGLPMPDDHAGTPLHAPVLIVPRIFEPDICRRLIAHYEADGGAPSGVMKQIGEKTVPVLDNFKRRRDAAIDDEGFRAELRGRLAERLLPEILKAYQFKVTRMERYIVAAYDSKDGGYFKPHRDNTTGGTAHRKFACSINLNSEEFGGGDLRFPEFGSRTYRPPTGGAVVFSCSVLHEATPVTAGRRYAFLPFFYDEEGARIRQANLHHVQQNGPEPR